MKYCSKCGNEMFDEAVVCVKCGCPVANAQTFTQKKEKSKKKTLLTTATILNVIAFVVSMMSYCLLFFANSNPVPENNSDFTIYVRSAGTGYYGLTYAQLSEILLVVWIILSIAILIFGIIAVKKHSKIFSYIYLGVAYIQLIALFAINPNMLYFVMCGLGLFLFAPTILQTIAGIMIIKGLNKDVA